MKIYNYSLALPKGATYRLYRFCCKIKLTLRQTFKHLLAAIYSLWKCIKFIPELVNKSNRKIYFYLPWKLTNNCFLTINNTSGLSDGMYKAGLRC